MEQLNLPFRTPLYFNKLSEDAKQSLIFVDTVDAAFFRGKYDLYINIDKKLLVIGIMNGKLIPYPIDKYLGDFIPSVRRVYEKYFAENPNVRR